MTETTVAASPAAVQTASVWEGFRQTLVWGRRALLAAVGLWVFMTLLQAVWVFKQAADISPWLALGWVAFLCAAGYLIAAPAYRFLRTPRVVTPPKIPPAEEIRLSHLRAEAVYLDRYLKTCYRNDELLEKRSEIAQARTEIQGFQRRVQAADDDQRIALGDELAEWCDKRMSPILAVIDKKAERVIYQEAMAVGLATAASPNGTLDAFMMLWRSVNTVSKLAVLYYGRPGPWGIAVICKDVSLAVAMAGYMQNVTESLGGIVARTVGGLSGLVAGPAIEGTTNALVLLRIGYLAQERCRSFRKWDARTRKSALLRSLGSTQRVAFGFTTELVRQIASHCGTVAGAMAGGLAGAANSAASSLRETFQAIFRAKKEEECA